MNTSTKESAPPQVKILTEREIQQRLYGKYFGGSVKTETKETYSQPWTGAEILSGELHHLRNELMNLRKEKERLAHKLSEKNSSRPTGVFRLLGRGLWFLLLLAGIGYPIGMRLLQASPTAQEFSPYTVQVAIYHIPSMAQQAVSSLQQLGYKAFFIESPYHNGKKKYHVYIGQFVTKQEADVERFRLTSDPRFSDAFVRKQ